VHAAEYECVRVRGGEPPGETCLGPRVAQLGREAGHAGEAEVGVERVAEDRADEVRDRLGDGDGDRGVQGHGRRTGGGETVVAALAVGGPCLEEVVDRQPVRAGVVHGEPVAVLAGDDDAVRVGVDRHRHGPPGQTTIFSPAAPVGVGHRSGGTARGRRLRSAYRTLG
jgi:hypothetical protein